MQEFSVAGSSQAALGARFESQACAPGWPRNLDTDDTKSIAGDNGEKRKGVTHLPGRAAAKGDNVMGNITKAFIIARRLVGANQLLIELMRKVGRRARHRDRENGREDGMSVGASGACLVYAGYPYDPFALDAPK